MIVRREFLAGLGVATLASTFRSLPAKADESRRLGFQALWLNDPEFLGYMIAVDKGLYAKEGLQLDYLPGGPNVVPEGSLLTRKADVALTQMVSTASAIVQKGAKLKVIGAQYQKSPLGVISLASSGITGPGDLKGRTIAVPTLSAKTFEAFAKVHGLWGAMKVVPYSFNPEPLINGQVDATFEFVSKVPFVVEEISGKKASSFFLDDHGLPLFVGLVTVSEDTLASRRRDLVAFLRSSRAGWIENFKDTDGHVDVVRDTWFKGSGSSVGADKYFNRLQPGLMDHAKGIFALSPEAIDANIRSLDRIGLKATTSLFDTTLLDEV